MGIERYVVLDIVHAIALLRWLAMKYTRTHITAIKTKQAT